MASLFKQSYTSTDKTTGKKTKKKSKKWYGQYTDANGEVQRVPLSANKTVAQQMLNNLVLKVERTKVGISDPFEDHSKKPLREHLEDFKAYLENKGTTAKQVRQVTNRVDRVLKGCQFAYIADISPSSIQAFLASLREERKPVMELPVNQSHFTKDEVAEILSVKPNSVTTLVRRHNLDATGKGKKRRFPRSTVEALQEHLCKGKSVQTVNFYLAAFKQFCNWLVKDRRTADNPVAHLSGGNVKTDRRHDRRSLTLEELRRLLETTAQSSWTFRGLNGQQRRLLYVVTCVSGFRCNELARLTPQAFNLEQEPPTVTLSSGTTKNRILAVQPLPNDVANMLQEWFTELPHDQRLWRGMWFKRAAEMLRHDLEEAGIPYVVDGPDGPLYADFHALRHTYISLLEHADVSLKQAMQLARHSDPKLTMARYGKAHLSDLGTAVNQIPSLLDSPQIKDKSTLSHAVGDEFSYTNLTQTFDIERDSLREVENAVPKKPSERIDVSTKSSNDLRVFDSDCEEMREIPPAGLEPATYGLGNRCSIH